MPKKHLGPKRFCHLSILVSTYIYRCVNDQNGESARVVKRGSRHSAASSTPPKASNPPTAGTASTNSATEDGFWYNLRIFMMKVWTALLVCGAAVSVVAWAVALLRENGVCPFAAVTRFVKGLPWGGRLVLLPLFLALVA